MEAVIVGFRHDNKTEGGVAGITFIFKDCVSLHAMNSSASSTGGWEQSEMREYLQDDLLIRLPEELRDNIVAVDKMSNNIGKTDSAKSVTKTSDKLWLPSNTELIGEMDKEDYAESDQFVVNIYNAEGTQYQLFTDNGVSKSDGHEFLKKAYADGSNEPVAQTWWIRSSFAVSGGFMGIGSEGEPLSGGSAEKVLGVAPGFCI